MARKKLKGSTNSFSGLGLDKEEDKILIAILKERDISAKQLTRTLIRSYIMENKL